MRLPRWTAYVALAVILVLAVSGIPRSRPSDGSEGAARAARAAAGFAEPQGSAPPGEHPRTVVLGIDGLDPEILAAVIAKHPARMDAFRRLIAAGGGILSLGTTTPPQSPVAWSSFITGRGPGGHGVFDFIHRDAATRTVAASTAKSSEAGAVHVPFTGWKVPTGGGVESNRSGPAFWTILKEHGVRADLYRVPINYPVEPSKGVSFPDMMTPALDSPYGMYTLFTSDPPAELETNGGRFVAVRPLADRIVTTLSGPPNAFRDGDPAARVPVTIYLDRTNGVASIEVGGETLVVREGQWTRFVSVRFDMLPLGAMGVHGIVRFYLRSLAPEFELYASPVNFDPLHPADAISAPEGAAADLARDLGGAYYTQGMAEEVSALKDGVFTDAEFMGQVDLVLGERRRMLDRALDRWAEDGDGGLLFFYVSTIDLAMHMMWRHQDRVHPYFDASVAAEDSSWWSGREGTTWRDVVEDLYLKMDPLLGAILDRVGDDALVVVMSDHGFAPYRRKFSLNTWLLENGYLVLAEGRARELAESDPQHVDVNIASAADWTRTRAYGIGFNGLYLNLAGREEGGIVAPADAASLLAEIAAKLEAIRDDAPGRPWHGERVVLRADLARDVYSGERAAEAPDIVVGYNAGYGNSDESTQGRVTDAVLADNLGGTFNGSHLMHPSVVSGVLLTNGRVSVDDPRLEDLTVSILARYGVAPEPEMSGRAILTR